jgi:hypothetical protein
MVVWVSETHAQRGPMYSAHLQCSKPGDEVQKTQSDVMFYPKDDKQISIGSHTSRTQGLPTLFRRRALPTEERSIQYTMSRQPAHAFSRESGLFRVNAMSCSRSVIHKIRAASKAGRCGSLLTHEGDRITSDAIACMRDRARRRTTITSRQAGAIAPDSIIASIFGLKATRYTGRQRVSVQMSGDRTHLDSDRPLTGTLPRIELSVGDPGQSGTISFFVHLRSRLRIALLAFLRTPMPLAAATATRSPAAHHLGRYRRGAQCHHRERRHRRNQPFRPIEARHRYPSTEPRLTAPRFGATDAPIETRNRRESPQSPFVFVSERPASNSAFIPTPCLRPQVGQRRTRRRFCRVVWQAAP